MWLGLVLFLFRPGQAEKSEKAQKVFRCVGGDMVARRNESSFERRSRARAVEKYLVENVLDTGKNVLYIESGKNTYPSSRTGPFDVVSLSNVVLTKQQFGCVLNRLQAETKIGSAVYVHEDRTEDGVPHHVIVRGMSRVGLRLEQVEYDRDIECGTIEKANETDAKCYDEKTRTPRYVHLLFKRTATVNDPVEKSKPDSSLQQHPVSTRDEGKKKNTEKKDKSKKNKKSASSTPSAKTTKNAASKKLETSHDTSKKKTAGTSAAVRSTESTLSPEDDQKISKVLRDPSLLALSGI